MKSAIELEEVNLLLERNVNEMESILEKVQMNPTSGSFHVQSR